MAFDHRSVWECGIRKLSAPQSDNQCVVPPDPGCQCDKELLIVAMGPGFKPLMRTFGNNPPGSGLVSRICPRSMGGKRVINA